MRKLVIYRNIIIALISISLGIVMLYVNLTAENGGIPYKEDLLVATGKISWVKKEKYGVKFQLLNNQVFLNYQSKLGELANIFNHLENSNDRKVSVLYKETIPRSGFDGDVYHDVWELSINGDKIWSYEESVEAWSKDDLWLFLVIPGFIFGGIYIGWQSWKKL